MKILNNVEKFKLSPTDKYIVEKIRENADDFLEMSISQFSKHVFCSISALSRLTNKIGFKNYSMFKLFVMNEITNLKNKDTDYEIKIGNKKMRDLASIYIETISKNIIPTNESLIKKMSQHILDSDRIITFGSGSSSIPAQHLNFNLRRVGIDSTFEADIHKIIHNILNKNKKQILILFSKSLKSKEVRFLIKTVSKMQIQIYLFSSSGEAIKLKRNNILIYPHIAQENFKFSISSKIASLYNVDLLLLYVYEKLEFNPEDSKIIETWNEFK